MTGKRGVQTATIGVVVLAAVLFLTFVANIAPIHDQCPWVFPRILSCILSARETLFAGLTAAGGAIFGAWLAFAGIQDQIDMARQAANEEKLHEAGRDVDRMKSAHGFVSALAAEFPSLEDQGVSKIAFAARLLDLHRTGQLEPSMNALEAPGEIGNSVKTVLSRLNKLAENLKSEVDQTLPERQAVLMQARDDDVRKQVKYLHQLSDLLRPRVLFCEERFARLAAQSKLPEPSDKA
jgi:hypothetical protein